MVIDTSGGHPSMDYEQHRDTYARFIHYTKVAIVLLALLLIGMYVFLV